MALPLQSENPSISTSCEGSAADASIALAAVKPASELRPSSALWNPSEPPALARPIGLRYMTVRTYTSFPQLSTVDINTGRFRGHAEVPASKSGRPE